MYLFGPRDEQLAPKGAMCGHATRALHNYVENLVPFVALDVALHRYAAAQAVWARAIWIFGRVRSSPALFAGVPLFASADGARDIGLWVVLDD